MEKKASSHMAPYPYVSLKEARDLRDEAKANLAKGLNPSVAKRQANEKA